MAGRGLGWNRARDNSKEERREEEGDECGAIVIHLGTDRKLDAEDAEGRLKQERLREKLRRHRMG